MGTLKIIEKNNHYFSRIHVEDIAVALTLSLKKFSTGQVFNISDNYPCPNEEIAKYAANLMKMSLPQKIKPEDIIVMATDGLWDNLFEEQVAELVVEKSDAPKLAKSIAEEARASATEPGRETPWSNGGGKLDDISVIAARVVFA